MVAAGNWTRQHGRTDREPARRELSKCETLTGRLRFPKEPVRSNKGQCVGPERHTQEQSKKRAYTQTKSHREASHYGVTTIDQLTGQTSLQKGKSGSDGADESGPVRSRQDGRVPGRRRTRLITVTEISHPFPSRHVPVDVWFGGGGCREDFRLWYETRVKWASQWCATCARV